MDASHSRLHPLFHWAQVYCFLTVIHVFDITYSSKYSNHSKNLCKMINNRPKVERLAQTINAKMVCTHIEYYCIMEYGKSTHDNEKTPTIMKNTHNKKNTHDNEKIHPQ